MLNRYGILEEKVLPWLVNLAELKKTWEKKKEDKKAKELAKS